MPCPFPGMDPFIERPTLWADFHDHLVTTIKSQLQPLLRPRYVALMQDRLYVVRDRQARRPDIALVRTPAKERAGTGTAVLDVDTPVVFEVPREEIREPLIEIIEPAAGNRIVTAIEVLSPDNKRPGPGRTSYVAKRDQYEAGGANVIEIDLLLEGESTATLTAEQLQSLMPWQYLVSVSRWPTREEVYPIPLDSRLPKIAVPLADDDADISLDLQAAMARSWDEGPYPELLRYDEPPSVSLAERDRRWCRQRLMDAGYSCPW